jgi:hypothetical protein
MFRIIAQANGKVYFVGSKIYSDRQAASHDAYRMFVGFHYGNGQICNEDMVAWYGDSTVEYNVVDLDNFKVPQPFPYAPPAHIVEAWNLKWA